jgi:uncharacterized protein (DUF2336 family)
MDRRRPLKLPMTAPITVIAELDRAIASGSSQQRAAMLMQIADLFVGNSPRFTDDEIGLFDDIITRLAAEIEISVRSLLAQRLAPIAKAPANIMRILASDDEIKVAYPVLAQSERVDEAILVQCARSKSQEHLLAISRRKTLSEVITDVLVERGNKQVVLSTVKNRGARFSEAGFSRLVKRSDGDDALAACVGSRPDIPRPLLLALLETASELVRSKLIAEHPHNRPDIHHAVAIVTNEFRDTVHGGSANNVDVQALIRSLTGSGQLGDDKIRAFVEDGKSEEITAALAHMCDVPAEVIEQTMTREKPETILILAKAAKLSWTTTKALLSFSIRQRRISPGEIEQCLASFERLNLATAQKIVEFYKIRRATGSTSRPF